MVVLFSALTGMIVGSLGTVVIFWLCGALQRKTVTETVSDKVNPELRDVTFQAEDTQATSTALDETSDFRQMSRTQPSFSYYLYIGTAETSYHLFPDVDNTKRGLQLCEICRTSSSVFQVGQSIYVSEQGQRYHLSRFCRTFKSLPITEYASCGNCCTMGHSTQVLFGNSIPRRRVTTSSTLSNAGLSED